MRKTLAAFALVLAASAASFAQTNVAEARRELDIGARAYRAKRFAEAEQHFRRALELDPEGKNTRTFIARAVQQQYKPGDTTPENIAAGERAVAAYGDVLARDPADEDAYKATVFLYGQMKRDDKVVELVTQRANDFSAPKEKRAEAFTVLASRHWQCSFDVTERKESKTTESLPDKVVIRYKMPTDSGDFIRARQCTTDGLMLIEQAVALAPQSPNALSYRANLLREAAKLAEMEGDATGKADYQRQYEEALEALRHTRARDEGLAVTVGDEPNAATTANAAGVTNEPKRKAVVSGGVLNGKAISKPLPPYPPEAKAAGAQGTVTVQILVDEAGNVASATAVSGHPLLQDAAVRAAREAKFSPTLLAGQPVKVSGVVTYNFVLQ